MKKNNIKKQTLKLSLKSLAFAVGLVGITGTTTIVAQKGINNVIENHEHDHDHEFDFDKVIVTISDEYGNSNQVTYNSITLDKLKNTTIDNYKGFSIVDALKMCGIDSSFNNRKKLAETFGIKNYRGTAFQNIRLLSLLKKNDLESLAEVSEIKSICKELFGNESKNVINALNLPNTQNITKSEFARIIREIAIHMNIDVSTHDNKLDSVINIINDVDMNTENNYNIAWAYYMGYVDVDENSNYNTNKFLTVNELNTWINAFKYDYNYAVINNKFSEYGLIIVPNQDAYTRDMHDISKINEIRNPNINKPANNNNSNNNNNNDDDKNPGFHFHKYGKWKYYNEEKEKATCNECGKEKFRKHKIKDDYKISYISNNDATHLVISEALCNGCNYTFKKESIENCKLSNWHFNKETNNEERECKDCNYKEKRKHNHDKAPSNLMYILDKSNQNGTHQLKATYTCNVCGEEITLYRREKCDMDLWKYNPNTKLDESSCKVCDYTKTRSHSHTEAPSNLKYTLDKSNNDGTHRLKAIYTCGICNEEITSYKDVNCSLSDWKYNPTTKAEERSCSVCKYKETRTHEHTEAPANPVYTLDHSNGDGTHKLKAYYDCGICGTRLTLNKTENCSYGSWEPADGFNCVKECSVCNHEVTKSHNFSTVPNSVTPNPTIGKHNITEKCGDCNFEKQVEQNCTGDGNKYYNHNGNIVTIRENCSVCHDVCKDDVHNHTYGGYKSVDDNNHKRECDCGNVSIESHNYGSWTVTSDGKESRTCDNCGHTQKISHTHTINSYVAPSSTHCYEIVDECTADGCDYETRTGVPHDYRENRTNFYVEYICNECGHTYIEYLVPIPRLFKINLYKKEEIQEEHKTNKVLVLK